MIRKKHVVQKSFRLDSQLSDDLELLSKILKRPQNEIYHMALEEFMKNNVEWFMRNESLEKLKRGDDDFITKICEINELPEENKVQITIKLEGEEPEQVKFNREDDELIKEFLEAMIEAVEYTEEEKEDYIRNRFNYR